MGRSNIEKKKVDYLLLFILPLHDLDVAVRGVGLLVGPGPLLPAGNVFTPP